jgi:hypothetical protein
MNVLYAYIHYFEYINVILWFAKCHGSVGFFPTIFQKEGGFSRYKNQAIQAKITLALSDPYLNLYPKGEAQ